jgi:hypothetical protein
LQYWVNGIPTSITRYRSRGNLYWRATYRDKQGKRHWRQLGKQDPRRKYIPIPEHPYQRKPKPSTKTRKPRRPKSGRFYMQIDGYQALVRAEYTYCSNTKHCACRRLGRKHGPYYRAYYWDKEAQKQIRVSLGNVAPEGFDEHVS